MQKNSPRSLSAYEQTQLSRYHISTDEAQNQPDKPIEYITGFVEFDGLTLQIDQRALIPRVETEELVALAADETTVLMQSIDKVSIADIGTGCGAVAISLAHRLKQAAGKYQLLATDISDKALELGRLNATKLNTQNLITFKQMDLLSGLPTKFDPLDIIIANLPYLPSLRIEHLEKSVKDYEPRIALDGGEEGFTLIRSFLKQAVSHLSSIGTIFLEIDYTHRELLKEEFHNTYNIETWVSNQSRCTFAKLSLRNKHQ